MEDLELIHSINKDLAVGLSDKINYDELHLQLAAFINHLIKTDFQKLVSYLYRIDVNEQKLKLLFQQHTNEDAGNIIASLIIERQLQKIKTRQRFSQRDNNVDEEKW